MLLWHLHSAVLDTGVDSRNGLLKEILSESSKCYNFSRDGEHISNVQDIDGHGTEVVGVIASSILGMIDRTKMKSIVFDFYKIHNLATNVLRRNSSSWDALFQALEEAFQPSDPPVLIVNISSDICGMKAAEVERFKGLLEKRSENCMIVISSGNDGKSLYPDPISTFVQSRSDLVLVGSLKEDNDWNIDSIYGRVVKYLAPGVGIMSSTMITKVGSFAFHPRGNCIVRNNLTGTSYAAPFVTSCLAIQYFLRPDNEIQESICDNETISRTTKAGVFESGSDWKTGLSIYIPGRTH